MHHGRLGSARVRKVVQRQARRQTRGHQRIDPRAERQAKLEVEGIGARAERDGSGAPHAQHVRTIEQARKICRQITVMKRKPGGDPFQPEPGALDAP